MNFFVYTRLNKTALLAMAMLVGVLSSAHLLDAQTVDLGITAPSNAKFDIKPMTQVNIADHLGYFGDPYPIHLNPSQAGFLPQYFSGTTPAILQCERPVTPGCFISNPISVKQDKKLTAAVAAADNEFGDVINLNVYQTSYGRWEMAVTLYVHPKGDAKNNWTVIAHAHPEDALSLTPPTAWIVDKVLIGSLLTKDYANYDGKYLEDDGKLYLIYSKRLVTSPVAHDGIVAQEMERPDKLTSDSAPVTLLAPDTENGGFNSEYFHTNPSPGDSFKLIETGNIIKVSGKYVMLYSVGDYQQIDYKTGVAFSDTLLPKSGTIYRKILQEDRSGIWGKPNHLEVQYLLQSEKVDWPNYEANQVIAPGVPSMVEQPNGHFLLYFDGFLPTDAPKTQTAECVQKGECPDYIADKRRPFFLPIKVDVPLNGSVSAATDEELASWIRPVTNSGRGIVSIAGNELRRDGELWVPHGVQLVAFVAPPKAQKPPFTGAYSHYSTAELDAIKAWGADTIRFQLSQPGADPGNTEGLYDPEFVRTFVKAVKYARSIGLNAIVSIQDESQSGESSPTKLPNEATNRVWCHLAPKLNGDDGIIYEMMNEPELVANTEDWEQWRVAMNRVIKTIRETGATNALLADGLNFALTLDGITPVTDRLNKVFYSSHPYYHSASDQTRDIWAVRFGNATAMYPVIVGEWTTATTYFTDSCSPAVKTCTATAALKMLQYMESKHIGLVAATFDFGLPDYGGIVSDYDGTPTTFAGDIQPGTANWGPGTLIQDWYRTGVVPSQLK